jgi:hypothetical protein
METKKRVSHKTKTEVAVDSFLWRLANRNNSGVIATGILVAAFSFGVLVSWVIL